MNTTYEPVPNQKFDIGRTINITKCDCKKCDFMHCPKNNYSVKQRLHRFTVQEFFDDNKDAILVLEKNKPRRCDLRFPKYFQLVLTYELITEFMDYMQFKFPPGLYWTPASVEAHSISLPIEARLYNEIQLVKFTRSGEEKPVGGVSIDSAEVFSYCLTESQRKFASKIAESLLELKTLICKHYYNELIEQDCDTYGWLSPTGEFYPCSIGEHTKVAYRLSYHENKLECDGWVRVVDEAPFGAIYETHLSAEQRNWLSLHGYEVRD